MEKIDWEKRYSELERKFAKVLLLNRENKLSPQQLLIEWDNARAEARGQPLPNHGYRGIYTLKSVGL